MLLLVLPVLLLLLLVPALGSQGLLLMLAAEVDEGTCRPQQLRCHAQAREKPGHAVDQPVLNDRPAARPLQRARSQAGPSRRTEQRLARRQRGPQPV